MDERLKKVIDESKNIVLFTGAGISVPSGIPDFRSSNGLYNQKSNTNYSPEEVVSHTFLMHKTELFYEFYKTKMIYKEAKPNKAHYFFADLEKQGKLKAVVTQNIDGLHIKAGNKVVYEIHGTVLENYCTHCGKQFSLDYIMNMPGVPKCDVCGNLVRPNVVLYEEPLDEQVWNKAAKAISEADCLIVVGTSLVVYPAAQLLYYFKGKNLVLINKQATPMDNIANLVINDDIIKVIQ